MSRMHSSVWLVGVMIGMVVLSACAVSENAEAPLPSVLDTQALVETLAADAMEGRLTGSDGSRKAGDYIVEQLEAIGAEALSGDGNFRQEFLYTGGVSDVGTTLTVVGDDGKE